MALFLSSKIYQGDDLSSVQSRGKQCAFMSLSALLTAHFIPLIQTAELGTAAPDIIFLENFCAPELHNIYVAQYIYCTICAIYILRNIYIERQLLDSRLQNKVSVFISIFK
jgi:hypothetical protein